MASATDPNNDTPQATATTRRKKATGAAAGTVHDCARPQCDTMGAERFVQQVPVQGLRNPKSVTYYLCRDDSRSPLARSQAQKAVRDRVRAGTWT